MTLLSQQAIANIPASVFYSDKNLDIFSIECVGNNLVVKYGGKDKKMPFNPVSGKGAASNTRRHGRLCTAVDAVERYGVWKNKEQMDSSFGKAACSWKMGYAASC
jgi:hypothetical protein